MAKIRQIEQENERSTIMSPEYEEWHDQDSSCKSKNGLLRNKTQFSVTLIM